MLLIASELATNAVIHARTPFTVSVVTRPDRTVRLEVTDHHPTDPLPRGTEDADRAGAWGFEIVAHLATRWGIDPQPEGKTAWAEITPDRHQ